MEGTYNKLLLIERRHRLSRPNLLIHEWLGEGRFIEFVVTPIHFS